MNIFFLFPLLTFLIPRLEVTPIETALKNELINGVVRGTFDTLLSSMHYGKCISMKLVARNQPVRVKYEVGQLLQPGDAFTQNIVLTEAGIIALKPHEEKQIKLYGMCAEKYDGAPGHTDTFQFNGMVSSDMTGLADLIQEKSCQNSTGQAAMWTLSDNEPIVNITGEDTAMVNELRRYVASIKGLKVQTYDPQVIIKEPEMRRLEVVLEARIKKEGRGTVSLYNPDGTLHDVLIADQPFPPGIHRFKFWTTSADLAPGAYKVVLMMDGVKRQEEVYFVE